MVSMLEPKVKALVDEHLDAIEGQGECDLVTAFSVPIRSSSLRT